MAVVINGNGTVTGIAVGGLPDGIVDNGTMADDAIAIADLAATGTASATTFLRGNNSWQEPGGGKVLQIVTATSNTSTTLSTTLVDVGGATVTITPSATTSKVLIMWSCGGIMKGGNGIRVHLLRDSTEIMHQRRFGYVSGASYSSFNGSFHHLDSPTSTSALVYKMRMNAQVTPTECIVNSQGDGASTNGMSMTAIEIGA